MQPVVYPPVHPGADAGEPTPEQLDNWQFAGYYVTGGVPRAVLQNEAEDSYQFVAPGDRFKNYTVESVSTKDHGEVVLVCGHTRQTLKPVEDFSLVALQGATITATPPTVPNPNPNMGRPMYGPNGMGPNGMGPNGMGPGGMGMRPGMNPGMNPRMNPGMRGPGYMNPNMRRGGQQ